MQSVHPNGATGNDQRVYCTTSNTVAVYHFSKKLGLDQTRMQKKLPAACASAIISRYKVAGFSSSPPPQCLRIIRNF